MPFRKLLFLIINGILDDRLHDIVRRVRPEMLSALPGHVRLSAALPVPSGIELIAPYVGIGLWQRGVELEK